MTYPTSQRSQVCTSMTDARERIARRIPAYHLDFVEARDGCACWHIFPGGSLILAGILVEEPGGSFLLELHD